MQALVHDADRLRTELPREARIIADTFRDYEDEFRKRWRSTGGRDRLLYARYLSIAQDLRIATTILRGAVRYSNATTIAVKRAEIRQAVRKLAGLVRDGIADDPEEADRAERMTDVAKALV
ncbi:hypothetical protein M4D58_17915 [Brevibacillus borstelensis]|uniref:hypothetical protein n=1 Tax=Brevibacillus borstelensis TaxID=45462 RepID=UPI00203A6B2A|nr:hypothetical protein [Brevibacillus borstelensis]MCM3592500.1 hypothetical protein [Brevibacillus borstelensis]